MAQSLCISVRAAEKGSQGADLARASRSRGFLYHILMHQGPGASSTTSSNFPPYIPRLSILTMPFTRRGPYDFLFPRASEISQRH